MNGDGLWDEKVLESVQRRHTHSQLKAIAGKRGPVVWFLAIKVVTRCAFSQMIELRRNGSARPNFGAPKEQNRFLQGFQSSS
tara:strand:- start:1422 stop:1667 length:246 start_codon:yes stop_codon:yes gene_type:complete